MTKITYFFFGGGDFQGAENCQPQPKPQLTSWVDFSLIPGCPAGRAKPTEGNISCSLLTKPVPGPKSAIETAKVGSLLN